MAYEMKDNTFRFEYRPENVDKKYPAIQAEMKVNGTEFKFAAWIRQGNYGPQVSGDMHQLTPFLKALFGSGIAPKAADKPESKPEEPKPKDKPVDRSTLLR